jgi:hypothetical protein
VESICDSDGRVTAAWRYGAGGGEQRCSRVDYSYGTNPLDGAFSQYGVGRLAATRRGCAGRERDECDTRRSGGQRVGGKRVKTVAWV